MPNQGRLDEALAWCKQGEVIQKLSPVFYILAANILQESGNPGQAVTSLRRALYLDPNHVLAHFALANIYHEQGKTTLARGHFRTAAELLNRLGRDELVVEAEGITAGRLRETIESMLGAEPVRA